MPSKRSIPVQIAGQSYTLRSDADDETVRAIAAFVDARLKQLQRQTRTPDTQALAVLAALQIAEELFQSRADLQALKKRVREKTRALLRLIERATGI